MRAKRADGVLTLTTLAAFANGWLLPRLHRFRERAPRIDVVLRTSRQIMDFRRDAIDLAIRFAPGAGPRAAGRVAVPRGVVSGGEPAVVSAAAACPTRWRRSPTIRCCTTSTRVRSSPGWAGAAGSSAPGLATANVGRGPQFSDSIVLIGAAVAGLGIAIGRAPHVGPLLARGQLVRVTQENWLSPWSYFLMAPPAHFKRPVVRTFVDWALEEARASASRRGSRSGRAPRPAARANSAGEIPAARGSDRLESAVAPASVVTRHHRRNRNTAV